MTAPNLPFSYSVQTPPSYCTSPQLITTFMKNTWLFKITRIIALHSAKRMFLNSIINAFRTKHNNSANTCLYIPKKMLRHYLLLFYFCKACFFDYTKCSKFRMNGSISSIVSKKKDMFKVCLQTLLLRHYFGKIKQLFTHILQIIVTP